MNSAFYDYWINQLDFIDIHYHAKPDNYSRRYNALEAGLLYKKENGAVVLKNHLGSTTSLAALAQSDNLPVFGSIVLNPASGGISVNSVRQALSQYQIKNAGRMIVHLPTFVTSLHKSRLKRTFANQYAESLTENEGSITNSNGKIKSEVIDLIEFSRENDIVLSSGHANKSQVMKLMAEIDKRGGSRLMLNQPANPMTGFTASELKALGNHDWLYIEQCALTVYLNYQTKDDFYSVLSEVNNVIYSSDLGQPSQPDIPQWLIDSKLWFKEAGLTKQREKEIRLLNPLQMLDSM